MEKNESENGVGEGRVFKMEKEWEQVSGRERKIKEAGGKTEVRKAAGKKGRGRQRKNGNEIGILERKVEENENMELRNGWEK